LYRGGGFGAEESAWPTFASLAEVLEFWFGTSPIQAEKSRPDRKTLGSAMLAHQGRGQQRADARDVIEPPARLARSVPNQGPAIELQNPRLEPTQLDPESGNTRPRNLRDPRVSGIGDDFEQLFNPSPTNRCDDPELG
jgi:hypothetical protein